MARSLTPAQFVERPERPERQPRHAREHHPVLAARHALAHLAHALRHPRLRHVGH